MAKAILVKPQPDAEGYHRLHEVIKYLGKKHRFGPNDYHYSSNHFERWLKKKGYGNTDPEGKHWRSSNVWYSEWCADPQGRRAAPPRIDFSSWLGDIVCKGSLDVAKVELNIAYYLNDFDAIEAPALQERADRVNALYNAYAAMVVPDELKNHVEEKLVQDCKLPKAIRKILGYLNEEFGPTPLLRRF